MTGRFLLLALRSTSTVPDTGVDTVARVAGEGLGRFGRNRRQDPHPWRDPATLQPCATSTPASVTQPRPSVLGSEPSYSAPAPWRHCACRRASSAQMQWATSRTLCSNWNIMTGTHESSSGRTTAWRLDRISLPCLPSLGPHGRTVGSEWWATRGGTSIRKFFTSSEQMERTQPTSDPRTW